MHIEFLVEEESAEAALRHLVPKIVGETVSFQIHVFQGKLDLLEKLPARLRGHRSWLPDDWWIVVLVDEDRQDCTVLKSKLETEAESAGLRTRPKAGSQGRFEVINRLAIEELEAWFFGDPEAVVAAYPRIRRGFEQSASYRDPDGIKGGTWEALERLLKRAGYYAAGLPKIEVARNVSMHMDPKRNRSRSFQVFKSALEQIF